MKLDATDPTAYPLLAFVHVPKTAGSTVKNVLGLSSPRGYSYCETMIHKGQEFVDYALGYDWISGHVTREALHAALGWLGRPIEYFSAAREPTSHVISQLNYSFERQSRTGYLQTNSLEEKMFDAEVRKVDFTNPYSVIALLLKYDGLVINMQSRQLLGADFHRISEAEVKRRLATYCYVATEKTIPELCRAFGFVRLPEGYADRHDNKARKHFGTEVFDSPELKEFLAWQNRYDERLYAILRQMEWPAANRAPFRPSLIAYDSVRHDNFDERKYLESNPDVADAVKAGSIPSGRHHFEGCGYREARMYREWCLPPQPMEGVATQPLVERLERMRAELAAPTAA
jgi:hypothetical protein